MLQERIRSLSKPVESGCWEWQAFRDEDGYGRVSTPTRGRFRAHRVSYEEFVGPIPAGLTIDHLCQNKACVNPEHLEPVTAVENHRRWAESRTHCKHGHEFSPENTYVWRNKDGEVHRACRTCNRAAQARYAARKAGSQ